LLSLFVLAETRGVLATSVAGHVVQAGFGLGQRLILAEVEWWQELR
jgi:hypothetical protein